MSVPLEFDFAQIEIGDGADPEVFTIVCDITSVNITDQANVTDVFRRDCAAPNKPAKRRVKTNSLQWDISGSGIADSGQTALLKAATGRTKNYRVLGYQDDDTDGGLLLGTFTGSAVLTSNNLTIDRDGDTTFEVTLAGNDELTFTPAS